MKANKMLWSATYDVYVNDMELVDEFLFICNENIPFPVLNLKSLKVEYEIQLDDPCRSLDVNKEETIMAIGTKEHVLLWDLKEKKTLKKMVVGNMLRIVEFSPEGYRLLVALKYGKLMKIDISLV